MTRPIFALGPVDKALIEPTADAIVEEDLVRALAPQGETAFERPPTADFTGEEAECPIRRAGDADRFADSHVLSSA
jgi:hypothetical protein